MPDAQQAVVKSEHFEVECQRTADNMRWNLEMPEIHDQLARVKFTVVSNYYTKVDNYGHSRAMWREAKSRTPFSGFVISGNEVFPGMFSLEMKCEPLSGAPISYRDENTRFYDRARGFLDTTTHKGSFELYYSGE